MRILALMAGCLALETAVIFPADVKENWDKNCGSCHGKDGEGETKIGKKSDAKDLTDATYQGSFADEQILQQIEEGLKDKSGKERMKPFRDKLLDDEIKALLTFVRNFKK